MKATPFNEQEDLEPIPFTGEVRQLALDMKGAGLEWNPHVGCFVWDRKGRIDAPSPFPHDVYFILNMNRFLSLFGKVEEMKRSLVWLPTWTQCMRILRDHGHYDQDGERAVLAETGGDLEGLYRVLLNRLREDVT